MQRVVWSKRAERDLERIRAYIGQFAPLSAQRMALKLVTAVESLSEHPHRGRPAGRHARELVVISPYLVRYRVRGDVVEVLRIRHGAQRPDR